MSKFKSRSKFVVLLTVVGLMLLSLQPLTPASAQQGSVVSIRAYGTSGAEVIKLQLNNKFVATFRLSKSPKTYNYPVRSNTTVDKLRVYFDNDAYGRDVNIDYVALDGKRHQSEARTTWSTGDFINGTCSKGNDSKSPWLYCNGYFKYTSAEGVALIGAASPSAGPGSTVDAGPGWFLAAKEAIVGAVENGQVTTKPSPPATQHQSNAIPAAPVAPPKPTPSVTSEPQAVAGNNGSVGCRQGCRSLRGTQSLDGRQNAVLENVIITNPGGRCLTVRNARNVTIRNVTFKDCGTSGEVSDGYDTGLILVQSSQDVTIENSVFNNFASVASIDKRNNALQIEDSPGTKVINNEFRDIRSDISQKHGDKGNRAIVIRGNNSHDIKIQRNDFINPGRNAVQLIRVRGVRGVEISHNRIEGRGPWDSDFEDMINLYSSSGTPASNIAIRGNYMRNGGPSSTGTAMILGDGSSSVGPSQHITVEDNVVVDSGHVGISLAGGNHITIRNNKVYSNRNVPSDRKNTVGFVMHHFGYSNRCYANTVTGNRVYQKNQLLSSGVNHVWDTKDCGVNQSGNVWGDQTLGYGIWDLD